MYIRLDKCPLCGHTQSNNYKIVEDYAHTHESFALSKCTKCNLIYTNPRPDELNIGKYYEHTNYISHTNKSNNPLNLIYKIVRKITLTQKRKLITKYTTRTQILDFGSGTGSFITYMNLKGYATEAYEPSNQAREHIPSEIKVHNHLGQLPNKEQYDIITAWHVIEHVHQLNDTIKSLKKSLKKDGFMFLAVPNINSYDSQYYDQYWAALDVPRHLYHFTPDTFKQLLKIHKLNLVDIVPMKFDSFYVSLLSEQYKTGKMNPVQAITIAIKSNLKAKATKEYSSLIYVIQK